MPSVRLNAAVVASATNLTGLNATTGVTFAAWVSPAPNNGVGTGIFRQSSTANGLLDGYRFEADGISVLGNAGRNDSSVLGAAVAGFRVNRWVHWAVTFDDSTNSVRGYVNGKMVGIASNSRDMTANASCTTEVGHNGLNGFFRGNLFDLQVLPNVVVPPPDIALLMNPSIVYQGVLGRWFGLRFSQPGASGTVFDESGNGNNLTASATLAACLQGEEPPWRSTYQ